MCVCVCVYIHTHTHTHTLKFDLEKIRLAPDLPAHNFCGIRGVFVVVCCVGHSMEYWLVQQNVMDFFLFPVVLYVYMID